MHNCWDSPARWHADLTKMSQSPVIPMHMAMIGLNAIKFSFLTFRVFLCLWRRNVSKVMQPRPLQRLPFVPFVGPSVMTIGFLYHTQLPRIDQPERSCILSRENCLVLAKVLSRKFCRQWCGQNCCGFHAHNAFFLVDVVSYIFLHSASLGNA